MPNSIANKIKLPDSTIIEINDNRIIVSNPQSGQVLSYDSINDYWTNNTISNGIIPITWHELYSLLHTNAASKGQLYCIYDYQTFTNENSTDIQSAFHRFDLIVLATRGDTLDCKAMAVPDDNYWNNSDLTKWQIWYDIENNTSKYEWANSDGCGVIYRMIDEYGNDCPYDFKNITYKMPLTDGVYDERGTDTWVYTFNAYDINPLSTQLCNDASTIQYYYCVPGTTKYTKCTCCNNIVKQAYYTKNALDIVQKLNKNIWLSIFYSENPSYSYRIENNYLYENCTDNIFQYEIRDVVFQKNCTSNKFLNKSNSIQFDSGCYENIFEKGASQVTFGTNCAKITFHGDASFIIFGNSCNKNEFSGIANNIIYGNRCYNNTYYYNAYNITYGNLCYDNQYLSSSKETRNITYGNECYSNSYYGQTNDISYKERCHSNQYEGNIERVIYGNNCYKNRHTLASNDITYENNCHDNTYTSASYVTCKSNCYFNTHCSVSYITFGLGCFSNTFSGDTKNYIVFEDGCNKNTISGSKVFRIFFKSNCSNNNFSASFLEDITLNNYCTYISITTNYYKYITIESGNRNITLNTPVDSSKYVQNIYIAHGVNLISGSGSTVVISDLVRDLAYRTTVARLSDNTIRKYCEDEDTWCAINVIDLRR